MTFTETEKATLVDWVRRNSQHESMIIQALEEQVFPWMERAGVDDFPEGLEARAEIKEMALNFFIARTRELAPQLSEEEILRDLTPEKFAPSVMLMGMTIGLCSQYMSYQRVQDEFVQRQASGLDEELERLLD